MEFWFNGKKDTGAELSVMPLNIYDQLNLKLKSELKLNPCNDVRVIGYSKQSVKIVGKVVVTCSHADATKRCVFYVTDLNDMKIFLGLTFCKTFNLVEILCRDDCICNKISVDVLNEFLAGLDVPNPNQNQMDHAYLLPVDTGIKLRPDCKAHGTELFPEHFNGLGTMKDVIVKLNVDNSITPVVQPPRKIPQAMIDPLKQEIEQMIKLGVIRKLDINEATEWCHNLVTVHKPNGKLSVCLDPRAINKALRFNIHNARIFQNVMSSIREVLKVSTIDAHSGFWTLPMDESSQLLTTFNTPWGRYCFTKMPFGLNQAQNFFQFYMDFHFQNINSTTNVIADDVMIHSETIEQHDKHLIEALNKCHELGLKLNSDKCSFGEQQV